MKRLSGTSALIVAIALGGLTSFLTWQYVRQAGAAARPAGTTPVVVAVAPIPARTALTADMVQVKELSLDGRHPSAATSPAEVVGRVVRVPLTPGEQVLTSKLFLAREESGLAFLVPESKRAVSVAFTEVIGSGGLILPGDRVDIVGVFEVKEDQQSSANGQANGSTETRTSHVATLVLQNVEVLAVAQRIEGEDSRDTVARTAQDAGLTGNGASQPPRAQPKPQPQAKTATLAVSPEEALRLVLAEERGKIRLALRRAGDDATVGLAELPLSSIVRGAQGR